MYPFPPWPRWPWSFSSTCPTVQADPHNARRPVRDSCHTPPHCAGAGPNSRTHRTIRQPGTVSSIPHNKHTTARDHAQWSPPPATSQAGRQRQLCERRPRPVHQGHQDCASIPGPPVVQELTETRAPRCRLGGEHPYPQPEPRPAPGPAAGRPVPADPRPHPTPPHL